MDELQPAQNSAAPPYKSRRGWLIAFGIIQILIAGFFLLMAAFMALGIASMPRTSAAPPTQLLYAVSLMYLGVAALFITTGIGSIRAKNWARITILALSWFWLITGVFSVLMSVLVMPAIMRQSQAMAEQQPGSHPLPENFANIVIAIIVVMQSVTMILIPLIFIVFYSSKHVKATCLATNATSPSSVGAGVLPAPVNASPKPTLPVPIIILVIWFIFAALSCAVTALWIPVAGVMGHVLHGAAAHVLLGTYAAISAYCAWSFYRLRIEGWWAAIVWYGFSACSAFVSALRLDPLAMQREAGLMTPEAEKMFQALPHFFTVIQFVSAVIALGLFIFILTTRRHFRPASQ